jgi:hypothetical protein
MKINLCHLFLLLIAIARSLTSQTVHQFVTLDTVNDTDLDSLMSKDWTMRLPEDVRKFKDQILAKLHLAHH